MKKSFEEEVKRIRDGLQRELNFNKYGKSSQGMRERNLRKLNAAISELEETAETDDRKTEVRQLKAVLENEELDFVKDNI